MSVPLPAESHAFFDGRNFATLATVEPDGRPQLSVVWIRRDGDDLLVSTVAGRRKHRNLLADPRATVLVHHRDDPYSYVEVRGTVTMTERGGRELIDELSEKYRGVSPFPGDRPEAVRVVVRISPERVVVY